jgi:hypothetical protein
MRGNDAALGPLVYNAAAVPALARLLDAAEARPPTVRRAAARLLAALCTTRGEAITQVRVGTAASASRAEQARTLHWKSCMPVVCPQRAAMGANDGRAGAKAQERTTKRPPSLPHPPVRPSVRPSVRQHSRRQCLLDVCPSWLA